MGTRHPFMVRLPQATLASPRTGVGTSRKLELRIDTHQDVFFHQLAKVACLARVFLPAGVVRIYSSVCVTFVHPKRAIMCHASGAQRARRR